MAWPVPGPHHLRTRSQGELLRSPFYPPGPDSSFHMPLSCCSPAQQPAMALPSQRSKILLPNMPNPWEPVSPTAAHLVSPCSPMCLFPSLLSDLSAPSLDVCPYHTPPLASLPFSPRAYPIGPPRLRPGPPPRGQLPRPAPPTAI